MSMRTRLAIVLAAVMIVPLLAAWVAIGVVVPRMTGVAAQARAARTAGVVTFGLAGRCTGVGEAAQSVAQRLATAALATGGVNARAAQARRGRGGAAASRQRRGRAGREGRGRARGRGRRRPADAAARVAVLVGTSCAGRSGPARGAPALAETVPVRVGGHQIARVVSWVPLDAAALTGLSRELGADGDLALLDTPGGQGAAAAAGRRAVVASTVPASALTGVLASVADGRVSGAVGGWRYSLQPDAPGTPYAVLALARTPTGGLLAHARRRHPGGGGRLRRPGRRAQLAVDPAVGGAHPDRRAVGRRRARGAQRDRRERRGRSAGPGPGHDGRGPADDGGGAGVQPGRALGHVRALR